MSVAASSSAGTTVNDLITLPCPHCATLNRVPGARLTENPTCGRCKQALFNGHPVALGSANFDQVAMRGDLPVIVDFWATWCGPCQHFAPVFVAAAQRHEPRLRFAKLDTDAAQDIAGRFAIRSIPTLVLLQGGRELARQSGALPAGRLDAFIAEALGR